MRTERNGITTASKLYKKLKADIVACDLPPGTSFSESDLARRYRVSRTPVREACRRLHDEGLIDIVAFRGYTVAPLTIAEFHNLQELQLILDSAAARLAALRANPDHLAQLEQFAKYEYKVGVKTSYYQFLENNRALHVGIAESTGNHELVRLVAGVHTKLLRYFYLGLSLDSYGSQLVTEHMSIMEAIRAHDEEKAGCRTSEHIRNTMHRSAKLLVSAHLQDAAQGFRIPSTFQSAMQMAQTKHSDGYTRESAVLKKG